MPNLTLASGQITRSDQLTIELVLAIETPSTILIPGRTPRPSLTPAGSAL